VTGNPYVLQLFDPKARVFYYEGLEPLAMDAGEHISVLELWPVICGPLTNLDATGRRTAMPFEGLRFSDAKSTNCSTSSRNAIHAAAEQSRAIALVQRAHWVRPENMLRK
jgi:hypothetical protein